MQYIHLKCLKQWLKQRVQTIQTDDSAIITLKLLNCELCKAAYPFAIYFNDHIYELIECKLPKCSYIVFEHRENSLIIISFTECKEFRIGRSSESEIMLNDMSVSREQAVLFFEDNEVWIEDTGSKFGTLLLMQSPHVLQVGEVFKVQCEKILMEFSIEKHWTLFSIFKQNSKKSLPTTINYTPEECLPGNGKHYLLVINKEVYNQFLEHEEQLRRSKTFITKREVSTTYRSAKFNETIIMRSLVPKVHNTFIAEHKGDTADNVNDIDCQ